MVNGSCLISGSCFISGETERSRLIRFELGGSARAALHSAHLVFRLPWGQPLHATQLLFCLPWGQGLHAAQTFFTLPWAQGLQSLQPCFSLPWGQGLHCAQLPFALPCTHRFLSITHDRIPRHRTPPRATKCDANAKRRRGGRKVVAFSSCFFLLATKSGSRRCNAFFCLAAKNPHHVLSVARQPHACRRRRTRTHFTNAAGPGVDGAVETRVILSED